MTASPYKPTTATRASTTNRADNSTRFGPPLVELVVVLSGCMLLSFRFTGLIAIFAVAYRFSSASSHLPCLASVPMAGSFCARAAAVFIAPYDVRVVGSTQHYGASTQAVSVLPVFGCCQTAHSHIRTQWPEYYTSHILNRPKWVLSLDLGKL